MGHLILVIERNADICNVGGSKATVMISSDNRSWELEGREEAEGKNNNFTLKTEGSKEATAM